MTVIMSRSACPHHSGMDFSDGADIFVLSTEDIATMTPKQACCTVAIFMLVALKQRKSHSERQELRNFIQGLHGKSREFIMMEVDNIGDGLVEVKKCPMTLDGSTIANHFEHLCETQPTRR
jgi:hypothetical protein